MLTPRLSRKRIAKSYYEDEAGRLCLDGVYYHHVDTKCVTHGWVKVDVLVDDSYWDNGTYI
jgi:hypothetical protein